MFGMIAPMDTLARRWRAAHWSRRLAAILTTTRKGTTSPHGVIRVDARRNSCRDFLKCKSLDLIGRFRFEWQAMSRRASGTATRCGSDYRERRLAGHPSLATQPKFARPRPGRAKAS